MARGNFDFVFSIEPSLATLAETYTQIADELLDLTEIWAGVAAEMGKGLAANLTGGKFKVLSKPYAKRKARGGFPRAPLIRTGAMLRKVQGGEIVSSGKTFLRTGLGAVEYEHAVNYGAMRVQGGKENLLEGRKFFRVSLTMQKAFTDALRGHIDRVLETAGIELERAPKLKAWAR